MSGYPSQPVQPSPQYAYAPQQYPYGQPYGQPPQQVAYAQPQPQPQAPVAPTPPPSAQLPKKGKPWKIVIAVAVVAVVVVAAIAVAVIMMGQKQAPDTGEKWEAYNFDATVNPQTGTGGKIKSWTWNEKYGLGTGTGYDWEFNIRAQYIGRMMEAIRTNKTTITYSPYDSTSSTLSTQVDTHKIRHDVTLVKQPAGENFPQYADCNVWFPTAKPNMCDKSMGTYNAMSYYFVFPKVDYTTSNGKSGSWEYYLTGAMMDEMMNYRPGATTMVMYLPYVTGSAYENLNLMVFHGVYGWCWFWFKDYTTYGSGGLKETSSSYTITYGDYTFTTTYTISKTTRTVGAYTFQCWDVKISGSGSSSGGGQFSFTYEVILSKSLPIPVYLKIGSGGSYGSSGGSATFEYTLTDVTLGT